MPRVPTTQRIGNLFLKRADFFANTARHFFAVVARVSALLFRNEIASPTRYVRAFEASLHRCAVVRQAG